jgi:hypothetical protein
VVLFCLKRMIDLYTMHVSRKPSSVEKVSRDNGV